MLAFSRGIREYQGMETINLAVFEDQDSYRNLITVTLLGTAYSVTAEATTRQQAFTIIDAMRAGELSVRAVLLDGNLDNQDDRLFSDAQAIYRYLRSQQRLEPIIGISSLRLAAHDIAIPPELDITKEGIVSDLVPALDAIFVPTPPVPSGL